MPAGAIRRLAACAFPSLSWSQDGRDILFASMSAHDRSTVYRVRASGGRPRPVELPVRGGLWFELDKRSSRLVLTDTRLRPCFYRVQLGTGGSSELRPYLASTRGEQEPSFSPDGRRVAFASERSGETALWMCNSDETGCRKLPGAASGSFGLGSLSWSPSGTRLAFDWATGGGWNIYVTGVDGGAPRRISEGPSINARPSWSRDGEWLYFASRRTGAWQVWKTRADPAAGQGGAVQVTRSGGMEAEETEDGRFLYYAKRGVSGLFRVSLLSGLQAAEEKVLDFGEEGMWRLRKDGVVMLETAQGFARAVRFYDFATGRLSALATLSEGIPVPPMSRILALSPDGKSVIINAFRIAESDIMLVENFQ
jgi:Tol biopolymer transport system component